MEIQRKDNLIAGGVAIGLHGVLLLLLLLSFLRPPNPPMGSIGTGMIINLGYVDEGTGEVQTLNPANDSPVEQEAKPEEITEEPTPTPEEQQPEEQENNEQWLSGEEETGVTAKNEKEESKETKDNTDKKTKPSEQKTTPTEKQEPKAIYGKTGNEATGGNNNGDKQGKIGDQGRPDGDINAKALYGEPGTGGMGKGGDGVSFDMSGWKMDFKIKKDDSDESGRLKFRITVDEEGEVIKIETLEKSVSTSVENAYKKQIENGSFVKERTNTKTAKSSTGIITIIIRSN